jgi:anti-repressor protein
MKNEIQIFKTFKSGKELGVEVDEARVVEIGGKTYFVGSDIAKALGYADPNGAVLAHCKYPLKQRISDSQGVLHGYLVIPEGDVYRLGIYAMYPNAEQSDTHVFRSCNYVYTGRISGRSCRIWHFVWKRRPNTKNFKQIKEIN